MIEALFGAPGAIGVFALSLILFGFAPGAVLAAIVRLIPDRERRRELQAELYEVPRWERPYWVAQQLEVAMRVGLTPMITWYWSKFVWHRAKIDSGLERHRESPDTFWVPSVDEKASVAPGDLIRLMWLVPRMEASGERMWVRVTHRDGDRLIGRLDNNPIFVHMSYDEKVKFHIDDIIDHIPADEITVDPQAA